MKKSGGVGNKHNHNFKSINQTYKNFEEFLLKNGRLPASTTQKGYWGVTPTRELFTVFQTLFEHQKNLNPISGRYNSKKYPCCKSFCDLGSGDGRVVLMASLFGMKKAVGVEFDNWLHKVSLHMRNHIDLDHFWKTKFIRDDFLGHNVRGYDYVYISPDRPFHRDLEEKFQNELNGKLIVHSYEFHPQSLKLVQKFNLQGEFFGVYENSK